MKKLLSIISISLITLACVFAKTETAPMNVATKGYTCPYCKVDLVHKYVEVGREKCNACKGKRWYGTHRTKQESREKGLLCDPCNYCDGRGTQPIKDYRWICPRCKRKFKID